ncbi:hypothetical protein ABPG75_008609 [Micractinium tetrahymenae]
MPPRRRLPPQGHTGDPPELEAPIPDFAAAGLELWTRRQREEQQKRALEWLAGVCVLLLLAFGLYAISGREGGNAGSRPSSGGSSRGSTHSSTRDSGPAGSATGGGSRTSDNSANGGSAMNGSGQADRAGLYHALHGRLLESGLPPGAAGWQWVVSAAGAGSLSATAEEAIYAELTAFLSSLPESQLHSLMRRTAKASEILTRRALGGKQHPAAGRAAHPQTAATAAELRHRLGCKLTLLELAAGYTASWVRKQQLLAADDASAAASQAAWQAAQPAAAEGQATLLAVLQAVNMLHAGPTTVQDPGLPFWQELEAAVDGAAASFGWQWQAAAEATTAARQQLGPHWWEPAEGQGLCADKFGLLRLLYRAAGTDAGSDDSNGGGGSGGGSSGTSVAELLESGQLGDGQLGGSWVDHLAAAEAGPYSESAAADVALMAGQLAVMQDGSLAWALPGSPAVPVGELFLSARFALGDTHWRLAALSKGVCLQLSIVPDRPLQRSAVLSVGPAAVASLGADPKSGFLRGVHMFFAFKPFGVQPFALYWIPPAQSESRRDEVADGARPQGPGPTALTWAAGELTMQPLPGCWALFHIGTQQEQGAQKPEVEFLATLQLELRRAPVAGAADQATAAPAPLLPSAPATPFPAAPAGRGSAVLSLENRYWQLLGQEQQRRWQVPPGSPAFASRLLQAASLPAAVAAVLKAANTSCSSDCLEGLLEYGSLSVVRAIRQAAQADLAGDDAAQRRARMARSGSSGGGSSSRQLPSQSWRQLLGSAAWAPLGTWLHTLLVHWRQAALFSCLGRRLLGSGAGDLGFRCAHCAAAATRRLSDCPIEHTAPWFFDRLRTRMQLRSSIPPAEHPTNTSSFLPCSLPLSPGPASAGGGEAALGGAASCGPGSPTCRHCHKGSSVASGSIPGHLSRSHQPAAAAAQGAAGASPQGGGCLSGGAAAAAQAAGVGGRPAPEGCAACATAGRGWCRLGGRAGTGNSAAGCNGSFRTLVAMDALAFPFLEVQLGLWFGWLGSWFRWLVTPSARLAAYACLSALHTVDLALASGYHLRQGSYFGLQLTDAFLSTPVCTGCALSTSLHTHTTEGRIGHLRLWWAFQLRAALPLLGDAACVVIPLCRQVHGCDGLLCMLSLKAVLSLAALALCWGGWVRQAGMLLRTRHEAQQGSAQRALGEVPDQLAEQHAAHLWQLGLVGRLLAPLSNAEPAASADAAGEAGAAGPAAAAAATAAAAAGPNQPASGSGSGGQQQGQQHPSALHVWRQELRAALRVHLLPLRALLYTYSQAWLPWGLFKPELSMWLSMWRTAFSCYGVLFCIGVCIAVLKSLLGLGIFLPMGLVTSLPLILRFILGWAFPNRQTGMGRRAVSCLGPWPRRSQRWPGS